MKRLLRTILAAVLLPQLLLGACGTGGAEDTEAGEYPQRAVEMIAPAGAGSGYDLTMRAVAQCLADTRLVSVPLPVTNKLGGGGAAALEYLNDAVGADDVLAVFSPPICLINLNGSTALNYRDNATPVARLITEYGIFAVRADSPYTTITAVMEALKADPKAVSVGGISAPGSMDHIQFLKIAHAAGVQRLDEIVYTGYQDGTAAAQLLAGQVDLISTGISDSIGLVESGDMRALAVTAEQRIGTRLVAEIPTCIEEGIDATFLNWRGIFGARDMPDYARDYWEDTLRQMTQSPEWEEICGKLGWDMEFMDHRGFTQFLDDVNGEYADMLQQIGLLD